MPTGKPCARMTGPRFCSQLTRDLQDPLALGLAQTFASQEAVGDEGIHCGFAERSDGAA